MFKRVEKTTATTSFETTITIVKSNPLSKTTLLDVMNDTTLSWGVKGLFAFCHSFPNGHTIPPAALEVSELDSPTTIKKYLKALMDYGVCEYVEFRDNRGRIRGYQYILYDIRQPLETSDIEPQPENQVTVESRQNEEVPPQAEKCVTVETPENTASHPQAKKRSTVNPTPYICFNNKYYIYNTTTKEKTFVVDCEKIKTLQDRFRKLTNADLNTMRLIDLIILKGIDKVSFYIDNVKHLPKPKVGYPNLLYTAVKDEYTVTVRGGGIGYFDTSEYE